MATAPRDHRNMAPLGPGRSKVSEARRRNAAADRRRAQVSGAEQNRRGGGLRRLPDLLRRLLEPAARRRGLAEAKLLTEWPTVVGPLLASRCHPIRLSPRSDGPGGVLVLHVTGAAALELQHSEPQILERINGYFGYGAVARLRLIQAPLPRRTAGSSPVGRGVSDAEESEIAQVVGEIRDSSLRAALRELGRTLKSRPGAIEPGAGQ
jgi:hypothetical protein